MPSDDCSRFGAIQVEFSAAILYGGDPVVTKKIDVLKAILSCRGPAVRPELPPRLAVTLVEPIVDLIAPKRLRRLARGPSMRRVRARL
jgi:hypothetical protein